MKLVTIFNEKGGTGKTTLSMMVASCLAYMMGQKVKVMDFDYPSHQFWSTRDMELRFLRSGQIANTRPPGEGATFYKVIKVRGKSSYTAAELRSIVEDIRRIKTEGDGYLFCDFPGHFGSTDASYAIALAGLIDLVVYPVDSDRQSQTGAILVHSIISGNDFLRASGRTHQEELVLWNRETRRERIGKKDWYEAGNATFASLGMPVSEHRIKDLLSMRRDSDTRNFVRSTVMFPLVEINRQCPAIIDITQEIKNRLDGME